MQTHFTLAQLADPDLRDSEKILRACVHCGFCLATCPTYTLLGDERDSPRGRIMLIKAMLESDQPPAPAAVTHLDRCLSCLSCMTTCPSGVHYMHLVDHARIRIGAQYRRPWRERLLRDLVPELLMRPRLLRLLLGGAPVGRWLGRRFGTALPARVAAMLDLLPARVPPASPLDRPQVHRAEGKRRKRVALLPGCVQQVLGGDINAATIRLLTRHGVEVVIVPGAACCGALAHHAGHARSAHQTATATIAAWDRELTANGLDAIVINASGCGTTVKDYGFRFGNEGDWAGPARRVADLARDVSEVLIDLGLTPPLRATGQIIAYHPACSMQHGQRLRTQSPDLLAAAGFIVRTAAESHLCCGSAGTYNMLQPGLARQLRDRKVKQLERTGAVAVAAGNLGCLTQIGSSGRLPVVHTVELLDWATGGPLPTALRGHPAFPHQPVAKESLTECSRP